MREMSPSELSSAADYVTLHPTVHPTLDAGHLSVDTSTHLPNATMRLNRGLWTPQASRFTDMSHLTLQAFVGLRPSSLIATAIAHRALDQPPHLLSQGSSHQHHSTIYCSSLHGIWRTACLTKPDSS